MGDKAIERGKGQTSSKASMRPHEYVSRAMDYIPGTRGSKARKAVSAMLAPSPKAPTSGASGAISKYASNPSLKKREKDAGL